MQRPARSIPRSDGTIAGFPRSEVNASRPKHRREGEGTPLALPTGTMLFQIRASASVALAAAAVCIAAAAPVRPAGAQTPRDEKSQTERPEVRAVEFHGVRSVPLGRAAREPRDAGVGVSQPALPARLPVHEVAVLLRAALHRPARVPRATSCACSCSTTGAGGATRGSTRRSRATATRCACAFDVVEGPPTLVDTVVVAGLPGALRAAGPARRGGRRAGLRPGEPLNLLRLDTAVVRMRDRAARPRLRQRRGRRAARSSEDTARTRARVTIAVAPRSAHADRARRRRAPQRARTTSATRPSATRCTFEPGDLLRRAAVAESQRALYESGLFRSALIDTAVATDAANGRTVCAQQGTGSAPRPTRRRAAAGAAGATAAKNVVVCVLEGPLRDARVGVGFTTADFFAGADARYTRQLLPGRPAPARTSAGTVGNLGAQQLNGAGRSSTCSRTCRARRSGTRPLLRADVPGRARTCGSAGSGRRATRSAAASSRTAAARRACSSTAATARTSRSRATLDAQLAAQRDVPVRDQPRRGGRRVLLRQLRRLRRPRRSTRCAGSSGSRRSALTRLDQTAPTTRSRRRAASSARAEVEHASRVHARDFRYNRAFADGVDVPPLPFRRARARAARARRLGERARRAPTRRSASAAAATAVLHPRKRFYAGGSQSVRGFGENQLGPRVLTIDPNVLRGRATRASPACDATRVTRARADAAARRASRSAATRSRPRLHRRARSAARRCSRGASSCASRSGGRSSARCSSTARSLGERSLARLRQRHRRDHAGLRRALPVAGRARARRRRLPPDARRGAAGDHADRPTATGARLLVDLTGGRGCCETTARRGCRRFPLRESDKAFRAHPRPPHAPPLDRRGVLMATESTPTPRPHAAGDVRGARATAAPAPPPPRPPHRPGRRRRPAARSSSLVVGAVFVLTNTDWGREQLRRRVVATLDEHGARQRPRRPHQRATC